MSASRVLFVSLVLGSAAFGQPGRDDPEFLKNKPAVGDPLPDLVVYTADGKEFKTSSLKGHYTVLDFGCLT